MTRSIAAAPAAVHAYVSDGANLPRWAPDIADAELERVRKACE